MKPKRNGKGVLRVRDHPSILQGMRGTKIGKFSRIGGGTNEEVNAEFLVDAGTSIMR